MAVLGKHDAGYRGAGYLCLATVAWGGMFPAAKLALANLSPVMITFVRYAVVALLFLPFLSKRPRLSWNRRGLAGAVLGGVVGIAGFNVLMLSGLQHTTPERAAVVMALLPLVTGMLRWVIGEERLGLGDIVCFAIAGAGIVLLVSHGDIARLWQGFSGMAELWVVGGVMCWAGYTVITNRVRSLTPLQYTTVATAAGALVLAPFVAVSAFTWSSAFTASALGEAAWPLTYMITVGGAIAILAWSKGVRLLGALNAALFINLIPMTAFAIGLAAGHAIVATDLMGGALVIASLLVHNALRRWPGIFSLQARKGGKCLTSISR